jgi:hypothetical protein
MRRSRRSRRSGCGVVLSVADRRLLAELVDDAIDSRASRLRQPCTACEAAPSLVCACHAGEVAVIEAYRALAARLGVPAP